MRKAGGGRKTTTNILGNVYLEEADPKVVVVTPLAFKKVHLNSAKSSLKVL